MDYERNEVDMKHGLSEFQEQTATLLVWSSYNSSGFQIVWLVRTIYLHKKKEGKKKESTSPNNIFNKQNIHMDLRLVCKSLRSLKRAHTGL